MLRLRGSWLLLLGIAALLALAATACGGGEEEEVTRTPETTGTIGTPAATGTPAVTPAATSSAAAAVPGITDTEIILGSHFPQSGTFGAVYAPILVALRAYFDYVNTEKGGVCGREIVLNAEDDQYDPAKAMEVTRKLVEQDNIFAMVAGVGTAAHSAVWDYLNERGIPDLWPITGAHKWGADPQAHPWTVAFAPDYVVEAAIFGKYISENHAGKKVAILYQNDDFGRDVLEGLRQGLDPSKNELVSEQSYEASAVDIRSQVTNLKETGAEVVVCACIPGFTAQAIKGANRMGWKPQWIVDYTNADPIMFTYAPPQDMEGTLSTWPLKLVTADDPAVAQHQEIMKKYGGGATGNFTVTGQVAGMLVEEILNRTCDNLTRQGLMDAVHSLEDYQLDLTLPGVTLTYSEDDHIGPEALRFLRAKVVDGKGVWEYEGELIHFPR
jgi:branched-chain amino acid transport system substrate-binding protein